MDKCNNINIILSTTGRDSNASIATTNPQENTEDLQIPVTTGRGTTLGTATVLASTDANKAPIPEIVAATLTCSLLLLLAITSIVIVCVVRRRRAKVEHDYSTPRTKAESIKLEQNDAYSDLPSPDAADAKGVCMEDNVAYNACKTKDGSAGLYSEPNATYSVPNVIFDASTAESTGTEDTGTYNYVTVK